MLREGDEPMLREGVLMLREGELMLREGDVLMLREGEVLRGVVPMLCEGREVPRSKRRWVLLSERGRVVLRSILFC